MWWMAMRFAVEVPESAMQLLTEPSASTRPTTQQVRAYWRGQQVTSIEVLLVRVGHDKAVIINTPAPEMLFAFNRGRRRWNRTRERIRHGADFEVLKRWAPQPPAGQAWTHTVYTTTLMGFEGQAYAPEPTPRSPNGQPWQAEIEAALEAGDLERAIEGYRHHQPAGTCSMDPTPMRVAEEYAQACNQVGHTGCALQMALRSMDYWNFDRAAWSTYGAMASPGATSIEWLDLDSRLVLTGLLPTWGGHQRPTELRAELLFKAIDGSPHRIAIEDTLVRWALDPELDEFNRYHRHATPGWIPAEATRMAHRLNIERVLRLDRNRLGEVTQFWLRQAP